jgi:hypothetical protein
MLTGHRRRRQIDDQTAEFIDDNEKNEVKVEDELEVEDEDEDIISRI